MQNYPPRDAPTLGPNMTTPAVSPTGKALLSPKATKVIAGACVVVVGGLEAWAVNGGPAWVQPVAVLLAGVCGVISPGWRRAPP